MKNFNIFSGIAILMSLTSLVLSLFCAITCSHDVNNVITALGVIVAILIGWQIYNVINMDKEAKRIKEELQREIEIVKDFNKPPYLDIIILDYKKDYNTLDKFKCEIYNIVNDNKHTRVLDTYTFMKVSFDKEVDLNSIHSKIEGLKKCYKKIKFEYYFVAD